MALSEHEQRLLDELERNLYSEQADVLPTATEQAPSVSTRNVVLAILAAAAGLAVIIVAVTLRIVPLGIAAFAMMAIGVALALGSGGRTGADGASSANDQTRSEQSGPSGPPRAEQRSSFMNRLDERWERRQRGE